MSKLNANGYFDDPYMKKAMKFYGVTKEEVQADREGLGYRVANKAYQYEEAAQKRAAKKQMR